MLLMTLAALASAANLVVDVRAPTDVYVDGHPVAKVFYTATVLVPVTDGAHEVALCTNNETHRRTMVFRGADAQVVVGNSGVSWPMQQGVATLPFTPDTGSTGGTVLFRSVGRDPVILQLTGERRRLGAGDSLQVTVPPGPHTLILRSADGTVIWARGDLDISGDSAVVQISDGRMPEVLGQGGRFRPGAD